ncbi:uncharacterized protein [Panulirus ornatus]|uniref:uncharacterized protein isoform X2 n=1 Tax=Panulirus ornatus TaxID=150431 RepID=UPI003A89C6A7
MLLWTMKAVMGVASILAATTSAAEEGDTRVLDTEITDQSDTGIKGPDGKLITIGQADPLGVFIVQYVIMTLISFAAIYIIFVVFLPSVENRSLSWGLWELLTTAWPADDTGLMERVLNSIDPVESAFALLQVEELACRRRTVCELQQAATRMPLVASLVKYISPSIRGLEAYREAQEAGAALEDCALLFAECPTNTIVQSR